MSGPHFLALMEGEPCACGIPTPGRWLPVPKMEHADQVYWACNSCITEVWREVVRALGLSLSREPVADNGLGTCELCGTGETKSGLHGDHGWSFVCKGCFRDRLNPALLAAAAARFQPAPSTSALTAAQTLDRAEVQP